MMSTLKRLGVAAAFLAGAFVISNAQGPYAGWSHPEWFFAAYFGAFLYVTRFGRLPA